MGEGKQGQTLLSNSHLKVVGHPSDLKTLNFKIHADGCLVIPVKNLFTKPAIEKWLGKESVYHFRSWKFFQKTVIVPSCAYLGESPLQHTGQMISMGRRQNGRENGWF